MLQRKDLAEKQTVRQVRVRKLIGYIVNKNYCQTKLVSVECINVSANYFQMPPAYFYRAMLAQSAVMRLHVVCLSVRLSVCNDQVPCSNRLEFFENNFTAE